MRAGADGASGSPPPARVVTVATASMLAQVRAMAESLRRHEPDWRLEVVAVGEEAVRRASEEFSTTSLEDEVGVPAGRLFELHTLEEIVMLVVPRVLARRCRDGGPVVHLPASAWILDGLTPVTAALLRGHAALFPRLRGELPLDGLEPRPDQLSRAGRFAADLVAVDGSRRAVAFLRWWTERLDAIVGGLDRTAPGHRPETRYWVNRCLETAAARTDVVVIEDPGCQLSAWNIHEHRLTVRGGRPLLDGRAPVRLMDLRDFEPTHPWRLSLGAGRARVSRDPVLRELLLRYAAELDAAGWRELSQRHLLGRRMANGVVLDDALERLFVVANTLGIVDDPLSPEGTETFMAWLREPAERGGRHGVTRYLYQRVLHDRSDVMVAFPDLDGIHGREFIIWAHISGVTELGIPAELLPPVPERLDSAAAPAAPTAPTAPAATAAASPAADPGPPDDTPPGSPGSIGVRLSGYLGNVLGLGAAARGYASALAAAGVSLSTVSVDLDQFRPPLELEADYGAHSYADVVGDGGHGFEVICVNPDELPYFVAQLGPDYFKGTRIGIWAWETSTIPPRWAQAYALLDEIWCNSRFMAEIFARGGDIPVQALPPPVVAPAEVTPTRLGVPDGFLFLYMFDYSSTVQRKNPVGLVRAFTRAFAPGEGPQLLIKTFNAPLIPLGEEEVLWAVGDRPDIHLVDRSLPAAERDGLVAACDCYVSLHRSEGFGLTIAEAMALGRPVIATAYGGNLDYMRDGNSLLVDYELTRVGPDCPIYPPDGEWAEPDIDHAARLMRHVYEHPEEAAAMGARARADIATELSPQATGERMLARLRELAAADAPAGARR